MEAVAPALDLIVKNVRKMKIVKMKIALRVSGIQGQKVIRKHVQ
jgi:hypothetical protein